MQTYFHELSFKKIPKPGVVYLFFVIIFLFLSKVDFAQTKEIDSMRTHLQKEGMDTLKVKTMNWMSYCFYLREMYDSAIGYAEKAMSLSDKLNFKRGMQASYQNLGQVARELGNYSDALQCYLKAYQINTEIGFSKGISHSANSLGLVYYYTGDYPTALKYYFESLKITEKTGDIAMSANIYNNIIDVYKEEGNFEEAKVYLVKLLELNNETKDTLTMGYAYSSLGENYIQLNNLDSALFYENKAIKFGKILNNKIILAYSNSYIGTILLKEGKLEDALSKYHVALNIADSIGDKEIISMLYSNLGNVNVKLHKFSEAYEDYSNSLSIAKQINDKKKIMQAYLALTHYDSIADNKNAVLEHYEGYILYRDSMFSEHNTRQIEDEKITYEAEKQQAIAQEESERKIQRQKLVRNVFVGGFGLALLFSLVFFKQRVKIGKEKKRSEDLLLNILPAETAEELKEKGSTIAKSYDMVTVLFTDFKNFTKASENLNAQELVNEINYCYSKFDEIVTRFGIEKIKTIGDGYMAAGGLPVANTTNAVDAVKAGLAIGDFIEDEKRKRQSAGKPFFEIRIGIHTGPVVAGVVGIKKFAYDIWGDTVNIASRMESSGEIGKVNISGATYEFVKDKFKCTYRGKVQAKNKGEIDMYFVEGESI